VENLKESGGKKPRLARELVQSILPSFGISEKKLFVNLAKLTALKYSETRGFFLGHWWRGPLLYALASQYKPRVVLELGTGRSYGSLALAYAASHFNFDTVIYSVDINKPDGKINWPIDEGDGPAAKFLSIQEVWGKHFSTEITGKIRLITTTICKALEQWPLQKTGPIDFCFIDADHSYQSVKEDFRRCCPLLSPNAAVLWDDYTERPDYGIRKLIDRDIHPSIDINGITIIDTESYDELDSKLMSHQMALMHKVVLSPALLDRWLRGLRQPEPSVIFQLKQRLAALLKFED